MVHNMAEVKGASLSKPRMLWNALRMYFGLGLLGVLGLAWSLLAFPLYYLLPRESGRRVGRRLIYSGFRFYLRALAAIGACRFDLSALDGLRDAGPMIIAPNHPVMIDAVLILSRLPGVACIMKSSILNNPTFGAGARLARYIRNDNPYDMVHLAVAELHAGSQLLLFPEGTRSDAYPIGQVRGSTGLIAKEAHVPVQTVLIELDSMFLAKGWTLSRIPRLPISYRVSLGRRFDPPNDVRLFMQELDDYFKEALSDAMLPTALAGVHAHD